MHTRIDHSGVNIMLDILCGNKRKVFRYYYIYQMDKDTIMLRLGINEKELNKILRAVQFQISNHLICKKCEKCGKHFHTPKENFSICDNCKQEISEKKKSTGSKTKQNTNNSSIKSPHEILKRMAAYNKKNNTKLSYGYYVYITGE